jgi:hypothetical protein
MHQKEEEIEKTEVLREENSREREIDIFFFLFFYINYSHDNCIRSTKTI